MNRHKAILGCMALSLPMTASAAIISIDFESQAHLEVLDNQFVTQGIDFGGTMRVQNSTLDAHSGIKEAFGPPFGSTPTRIDAVGAAFDMFGAWFRGHNANNTLTISAFNAADVLVGSVNFITPPSGHTHGFLQIDQSNTGGQPFAYVEIIINSVGYSMDDMQFQLVPTPGSVALLGASGLIAIRRRRRA